MKTTYADVLNEIAKLRGLIAGALASQIVVNSQATRQSTDLHEMSKLAELLADKLTDARLDELEERHATLPTMGVMSSAVYSLLAEHSNTQILLMMADECQRQSIKAYNSGDGAAAASWSDRWRFWRARHVG